MKRIGCIGFGKMGMLHTSIINAFHDTSVISIVEPSNFVRSYADRIMEDVKFYKDHKEMVENEELDGVLICTPVANHAEMMNYLYKYNMSMFVEKPLCRNLDELEFSKVGLLRKNISLVTGYCLLFKDTFVKAKEFLNEGILGKVLWCKGFINVQQIFERSNHWQYDKEIAGGGVMINIGSHLVSVLVDFFGEEKEVFGLNRIHYSKDVEDMSLALIKFENEVICSVEASWSKYNHRLPKATIEINGEFGQIFVDETEIKIFMSEEPLL